MSIFNKYPYTDFHELNLDMMLEELKRMNNTINNFIAIEKVKFADPIEYDYRKSYEINTIVLGSDGNSYIAKKEVSPGHIPPDEEYWMKIGDYNAQIESVSETKENKHSRILMIGDSYLDTPIGYGHFLNDMMVDSDIIIKAESGAGFTHYSTVGGHTFEGILDIAISEITEPETITDIIVVGGSNDRDSISNIDSFIANFMNKAKNAFPNARKYLGFCGWTRISDFYGSDDKMKFINAMNEYKKCVNHDCSFISGLEYVMHDYSHYIDNGHPDEVLEKRIADFIYNFLLTGCAIDEVRERATFDYVDGWSVDLNLPLVIDTMHSNNLTIADIHGVYNDLRSYGMIQLKTSNTLDSGLNQIATITGGCVFGVETDTVKGRLVPCQIKLYKTDSTAEVINGNAGIINGKFYIYLPNDYGTYTNVDTIRITPLQIVYDTIYA